MTALLRNPRLLATTIGLIVVAGLSSLATIVRQEDPSPVGGLAVVVAPYPGATAENVEALVTNRIEDELRELPNIESVTSVSKAGVAVVSVLLDERLSAAEMKEGLSKVRDALDDAYARFPHGAPRPTLDDSRFGSYAVTVGVTWMMENPPSAGILKRFAEDLQSQLRDIPGTGHVKLFGSPREEISVTFEPYELSSLGLTSVQLSAAIAGADAKVSAGALRSLQGNLLIEVTGAFDSLDRIRRIPIAASPDGATLRVGDIAEVERTTRVPPGELATVDGRPAVVVAAKLAEGERFDIWGVKAHAVLDRFSRELPDGVTLKTVFDQTRYTEERLSDLARNLITGFIIVVVVLLLTLGVRSAVIVGATIPLVALTSIAVLRSLGVAIHHISVGGLIVALGLLVDNAIVVVDSIRSKRLRGASALSAIGETLHHLWVPLLSSTTTTILAFMPILLLTGRLGSFVGALGSSVIISIAASYLFAMSVVPALAGRFLLPAPSDETSTIWSTGIVLPRIRHLFERSLDWSVRHPKRSMAVASALPALGFLGVATVPQQFFPPADRDHFTIEMRLPEQASIYETARTAERVDAVLRSRPEIIGTHWFIGRSAPPFYYNLTEEQDGTPSFAQAKVDVRSVDDVATILPTLQDELDLTVPHVQVLVRELLQGPPVNAPVEVRIYGPDLDQLRDLGEQLRERMSRVAAITHSLSTLTASSPKVLFFADEDEVTLTGLTLVDLASQLNSSLDGVPGGSLMEHAEEIPLRIRVVDRVRGALAEIGSTPLVGFPPPARSDQGVAVNPEFPGIPVAALAEISLVPVLDGIPHRNGRRVNVVRGYTDAGVFAETAFSALEEMLIADPIHVPAGYSLETGGDSEERGKAMANLFTYAPVLLVLMIATIALSLDSFRLAAVVFAVAVQSVGLGFFSLALLRYPLGFQGVTGLLGLVGVAINAAIVINASLRANPQAVAGSPTAIRDVVMDQTSRHIVSTTITTFGGFLPLLLLSSGGLWPPFAAIMGGGVLLSSVISFYFVPAAFLLVTRHRMVSIMREGLAAPQNRATAIPEAAQ